jgi:hypothetical protein
MPKYVDPYRPGLSAQEVRKLYDAAPFAGGRYIPMEIDHYKMTYGGWSCHIVAPCGYCVDMPSEEEDKAAREMEAVLDLGDAILAANAAFRGWP